MSIVAWDDRPDPADTDQYAEPEPVLCPECGGGMSWAVRTLPWEPGEWLCSEVDCGLVLLERGEG